MEWVYIEEFDKALGLQMAKEVIGKPGEGKSWYASLPYGKVAIVAVGIPGENFKEELVYSDRK